jgi:hypothetical protein
MGGSAPLRLFHRTSFSSAMGASSNSLKSIFLLAAAPYDLFVFFTVTSICGVMTLKGGKISRVAE